MKKLFLPTAGILFVLQMFGCTPAFQGEYTDPNALEIIDDKWNETDARKTAETLIASMLSKPWLTAFSASHKGKKPVLMVDEIENRTDEHIDTQALTEFVRNELINSGKITFLNEKLRKKIIDELEYQHSGLVDSEKARQIGKQSGAEFMLSGALTSQVHTQGGVKTTSYQTTMTLTDLESGEITWSEKYLVRKKFQRSGSKW
jgi:uncharacterized protein (TIGR02722 family)